MATAEISISVRLDPGDEEGPGIADDAETVYDDRFYITGSIDDAMSAAEDTLAKAKAACYQRALAPDARNQNRELLSQETPR